MAPNGAGKFFFLLIQTLPTFWAEQSLILRIILFLIFWDPKFPDFQNSRNLAWARLVSGGASVQLPFKVNLEVQPLLPVMNPPPPLGRYYTTAPLFQT